MLESMLKICIYIGINADVTLEDGQRTTECEDRAILKQNSQYMTFCINPGRRIQLCHKPNERRRKLEQCGFSEGVGVGPHHWKHCR